MSKLLLEQELSFDLFADANVHLTPFGHDFFKLVGMELRVETDEQGAFNYTLTVVE